MIRLENRGTRSNPLRNLPTWPRSTVLWRLMDPTTRPVIIILNIQKTWKFVCVTRSIKNSNIGDGMHRTGSIVFVYIYVLNELAPCTELLVLDRVWLINKIHCNQDFWVLWQEHFLTKGEDESSINKPIQTHLKLCHSIYNNSSE